MNANELVEEILNHREALVRARAAAGSQENLAAIKRLIEEKQAEYDLIMRENDTLERSGSKRGHSPAQVRERAVND